MKKVLIVIVAVLAVAGVGIYAFQEPLKEAAIDKLTENMFLDADSDTFNPGLPVGEAFPAVQATMAGRTVTDVSEFAGPNGLVFVANRSVDW